MIMQPRESLTTIQSIVFLDIDNTLLFSDPTTGHKQTINYQLLDTLIQDNHIDLYLFSNMDLRDIKYIYDQRYSNSITRERLIDILTEMGFTVHGVITPADPSYNKGPGGAYRDFYRPAYEKAKNHEGYEKESLEFDLYRGRRSDGFMISMLHQNSAVAKYSMFEYFLKHKSASLNNLNQVIYYDDDVDCLEAVQRAIFDFHESDKKQANTLSSAKPVITLNAFHVKSINKTKKYTPTCTGPTTFTALLPNTSDVVIGACALLVGYGLFKWTNSGSEPLVVKQDHLNANSAAIGFKQ
jgi:hypothetical protein